MLLFDTDALEDMVGKPLSGKCRDLGGIGGRRTLTPILRYVARRVPPEQFAEIGGERRPQPNLYLVRSPSNPNQVIHGR